MDALIFSGQSNMQGQTERLPEPNESVAGAWEYRLLTDSLQPLRHPVGEDIAGGLLLGAHLGRGSLAPAFCRAYRAGTGENVLAVHAARGATTAADWLPPSARFDSLAEKCRRGLLCAEKREPVSRVWFVWLQGESDAAAGTTEEAYIERLSALKAALDEELPLSGFLIIRVGRFTYDARDYAVMRAEERLCRKDGFTMLTRIAGELSRDARFLNPEAAGHFNNAAMEIIGERAGSNAARLARGLPFTAGEEPFPEVAHG